MIRVFPSRTNMTPDDELSFVGDPPFELPPEQPVRVSVVFTWDVPEGQRLAAAWAQYYKDVQIGGPAFGDSGGDFEPGRFVKTGVTITSRGCNKKCAWCFVPPREGRVRELPIREGYIVQDNNLLACSRNHIEAVFDMLRHQRRAAVFSGGIDVTLLQNWHRELFDSIKFKELWFACDTQGGLPQLERAARILDGIPASKRRCYTMIGFNGETLAQAEARLERVFEMGYYPFSQLYQDERKREYSREWKALNRKWSRPAAYKAKPRPEENLSLFPDSAA